MQTLSSKECHVQGCRRPIMARGYCVAHYKRWKKNADMHRPIKGAATPHEVFTYWLERSKSAAPEKCWLWKGPRDRSGYGKFWWGDRYRLAHRYSFELHNGPIAEGMVVCHRCDAARCVNPAHLFLGTRQENTHDAAFKGRLHTRLRPEQVRLLRKAFPGGKATQQEWADAFGVNQGTISRVLSGEAWWHVED